MLTFLSIKSPSLLSKKERTANCVTSLLCSGPFKSLSPSPMSSDISLIVTSESVKLKLSSSVIVTLFLNWILPVLFSAVIKSPTKKSPNSFVPDV